MLTKKLLFLILILATLSFPGVAAAACPAAQSNNLTDWVEDLVDCLPGPGSNGFDEPDPATEIPAFREVLAELLADDWTQASLEAGDVGYQVLAYTDAGNGNETIYALVPLATNTAGRGYFFIRPQSQVRRNLIIEAPHPVNDQDSALVASRLFQQSGARAFFFAGTHRCANLNDHTTCSGTSTVCGDGDLPYRRSDMAHYHVTFFQAFHEAFANEDVDTLSLQIHGFGSGLPTREFSVSDGTHHDRPTTYLTNRIAARLEQQMAEAVAPADPARPGNSCNRLGQLDELCATENVQGRFLNASTNICSADSAEARGRFVHLELSKDLRDVASATTNSYPSQIVIDALLAEIPERQGRVGDLIWADLNGNGVRETGEPGLDGVTVQVVENVLIGPGVDTSRESANGGAYLVTGLPASAFEAIVHIPDGFSATSQTGGDSDVDGSGRSGLFSLAANEKRDIDAGLVPVATDGRISGRAWTDSDGDGIRETGEPGLTGRTVQLLSATGTVLASQLMATDTFQFDNLLPGRYRLRFDIPTSLGVTFQNTGTSDTVDSDIDRHTGETGIITLTSTSRVSSNNDAGFVGNCFEQEFVGFGATWKAKIYDGSSIDGWFDTNYAGESSWTSGPAPLGYNRTDLATALSSPADPAARTVYFRRSFSVTDPTLFQWLNFQVTRDDGVVVYLNGVEVFRNNMPPGLIGPQSTALDSSLTTVSATVPAASLLAGVNVLAVELHNRGGSDSSPDGKLDLRLTGTMCQTCRIRSLDLAVAKDTHIEEENPGTTYGSATVLQADGSNGDQERAFLEFMISSALAGADLLQAEVILNITNSTSANYALFAVKREWDEKATWVLAEGNTTPTVSWGALGADSDSDKGEIVATIPKSVTGSVSVPLNDAGLALIEQWISSSSSNHGLMIARQGTTAQDDNLDIASNNHSTAANRPKLRVRYIAPSCPQ
jgi:hypothetical protein